MGRNRKNKSEEFHIANNQAKHSFSKVKVPFFQIVTIKVKISEDKNAQPIYGTTEKIIHESQKTDFDVINSEQLTIALSNLCPDCHKLGIPKIERKSNQYDYHARAISPLVRKEGEHKTKVNRADEYRLTFDHTIDGKLHKCIIATFDQNNFLFKPNSNKINELHKTYFPHCADWINKITAN